jgi:putative component of membrane protein insertase Oxa1/YidC/SpoIIIJ protein YidD
MQMQQRQFQSIEIGAITSYIKLLILVPCSSCRYILFCSHYMHDLGLANEAIQTEFVSGGLLTAAAMPGFEFVHSYTLQHTCDN